jgi:hypothetical protein
LASASLIAVSDAALICGMVQVNERWQFTEMLEIFFTEMLALGFF